MRRALTPVPASAGRGHGTLSGMVGFRGSAAADGVMPELVASKLLARRLCFGRLESLKVVPLAKLTARPRSEKPVDARFFFLKSSVVGMVGSALESCACAAISKGEPGDGGLLDRVVAEDLFMENRRPRLLGWAVPFKLVSEAGAVDESASAKSCLPDCEFVLLKMLDTVRRKPPAEPRVDRLDRGV